MQTFYPPSSREVANLTERKNPHAHAPVYGVKEFVRLSVCLLQTLTPIISGLAEQNGLKFFIDIFGKMNVLNKFYLSEKWPAGPGRGPKKQLLQSIKLYIGDVIVSQKGSSGE